MQKNSFIYSVILLSTDALTIVGAFSLAYIFRVSLSDRATGFSIDSSQFLAILLTLVPFVIFIFALPGLYNRLVYENRFQEFGRLFVGATIGTLFLIAYDFFTLEPIFPAKLVPIYGFYNLFAVGYYKEYCTRNSALFISKNIGVSNLLIVGKTQASQELIDYFAESASSGYKILGIVGGKGRGNIKSYKTFEDAILANSKRPIHSIMQTELYSDAAKNNQIPDYAQNNHAAFRFIPGNSELFVGNIDVELFQQSIPMIQVNQTALYGWGQVLKRVLDTLFALILAVVGSPLIIVTALLIKLFDPGSILFRQTRLTRFGREFTIYKFRTMKTEFCGLTPEEAFDKIGKPELAKKYRENGDKLASDPRITRLGSFLRRTSLDELPQLINVLKGDISFVGPRALIPQEISAAEGRQHIFAVKSGMTGLAVVSGRRNISFEERRKRDIYYVQNWSIWLDVIIVFKTIKTILSGN